MDTEKSHPETTREPKSPLVEQMKQTRERVMSEMLGDNPNPTPEQQRAAKEAVEKALIADYKRFAEIRED